MDFAFYLGFGLVIIFFIWLVVWLIKDFRNEKKIKDHISRNEKNSREVYQKYDGTKKDIDQ